MSAFYYYISLLFQEFCGGCNAYRILEHRRSRNSISFKMNKAGASYSCLDDYS